MKQKNLTILLIILLLAPDLHQLISSDNVTIREFTTESNGNQSTIFSDGMAFLDRPDGLKVTFFRDGTMIGHHSDETIDIVFPNGITIKNYLEGGDNTSKYISQSVMNAYYQADCKVQKATYSLGSHKLALLNAEIQAYLQAQRILAVSNDNTRTMETRSMKKPRAKIL